MFAFLLILHANVRGVESLAAEPRMGNGIPTTTSGSMESVPISHERCRGDRQTMDAIAAQILTL